MNVADRYYRRIFGRTYWIQPPRSCVANRPVASLIMGDDAGFSIMEIIIVIVITGLLAGIFSEILTSSIEIYTQHTIRKTAHIDVRRSFDMLIRDGRELVTWTGNPNASRMVFEKYDMDHYSGWWLNRDYYTTLRVGYRIFQGNMKYRRNEDGVWGNQYSLLSGIDGNMSHFNVTTAGGTDRIQVQIRQMVLGRQLLARTTVFPRQQGG